MLVLKWSNKWLYNKENVERLVSFEGNYYIAARLKDKSYTPIYVGKGNIRQRLFAHFLEDEPNKCLKTDIKKDILVCKCCQVIDETNRINVDHTLHHYWKSSKYFCDKQKPKGQLIDITKPYETAW